MIKPMPFDCVLFDMDGTLIDTIPFIVETFQHVFDCHHITDVTEAHILAGIGTPLEAYLGQFKQADLQTLIDTYVGFNERWLDQAIAIFLGVPDMLTQLRALNIPVGVVTSKRSISALKTLEVFALDQWFDIVVVKEDTKRHKPHPEPLHFAMRQLGFSDPARVLYVGDSVHDILSANAAGCPGCAVAWSRMPHADLLDVAPLYWANTPQEIVGFAGGHK